MPAADTHTERFHALDATRAFALLLGVVFHAAWFYTLDPNRTPVTDVQSNHFLGWFFHASHCFRMQLFFLIAGFFARLVFYRRGFKVFARNRLIRIGIPFVVGWAILYPLFLMVWLWGKNLSGQNAEPISPVLAVLYVTFSGLILKPRPSGGAFALVHLWFLYYLLIFYVLAMVGYWLASRSTPIMDRLRHWADRFTRFLTHSPWGAGVFAILLTPLLWSMKGWMGVDTPGFHLRPHPGVTAAYFAFFLLGWLMHRQAHRLGDMFRHWKIYLVTGLLGTIGVYAIYMKAAAFDAELPPHSLAWRDVQDWSRFRTSLLDKAGEGQANNPVKQLWEWLPEGTRELIRETPSFNADQKLGILEQVNLALIYPDLLNPNRPERPQPPARLPMHAPSVRTNRMALDPHWQGVAHGDYREASWYPKVKLGYSTLYGLVSVLMVFGCLGAFQSWCQGFSPTWRYLADSSYWVYLIHLPVVPVIELLIFQWPLTSWIKFPLLLLVSFVVLYASYHYLARSTFIGRILNGKAHPFYRNPLRSLRH